MLVICPQARDDLDPAVGADDDRADLEFVISVDHLTAGLAVLQTWLPDRCRGGVWMLRRLRSRVDACHGDTTLTSTPDMSVPVSNITDLFVTRRLFAPTRAGQRHEPAPTIVSPALLPGSTGVSRCIVTGLLPECCLVSQRHSRWFRCSNSEAATIFSGNVASSVTAFAGHGLTFFNEPNGPRSRSRLPHVVDVESNIIAGGTLATGSLHALRALFTPMMLRQDRIRAEERRTVSFQQTAHRRNR